MFFYAESDADSLVPRIHEAKLRRSKTHAKCGLWKGGGQLVDAIKKVNQLKPQRQGTTKRRTNAGQLINNTFTVICLSRYNTLQYCKSIKFILIHFL